MYVTDFREEALKDVIESLDSALFERVTGLTVEDFQQLSNLGLFNAQNMTDAIYQFTAFEEADLHFAGEHLQGPHEMLLALWDRTAQVRYAAAQACAVQPVSCMTLGPWSSSPRYWSRRQTETFESR